MLIQLLWSWLLLLQGHTAVSCLHVVHRQFQFLFCQTSLSLLDPCCPAEWGCSIPGTWLCVSLLSLMRFFSDNFSACYVTPEQRQLSPPAYQLTPLVLLVLSTNGSVEIQEIINGIMYIQTRQTNHIWDLLCATHCGSSHTQPSWKSAAGTDPQHLAGLSSPLQNDLPHAGGLPRCLSCFSEPEV